MIQNLGSATIQSRDNSKKLNLNSNPKHCDFELSGQPKFNVKLEVFDNYMAPIEE